ncbi:serine/threonine protein kinase [Nostoc sp. FACHB-87]|uniref:serine/threonine-protein kinase n=1 Tax=Nostocaceae TaxID=1162 RepID=UPI00168311A0|nr:MULTISPECIES: serine/threonine-protein kinase [Nostocaceae]MBD2303112.1 serine/threonine protein kinase [Nostoc sp. FACHB-190]MBD2458854.1 serine/threonine protein kinase [Nostoc sp. FACHB-87]MBD2479905.1 serine/threonine protein kinase [Anabaena sp. FACHB-83]
MSYCINPFCPKPSDLGNARNRICHNCGSEILLKDRYRVLKQIGKGGFGNTFEVEDYGTIKVLKVLTENNEKAIELFQQEAKVLSKLNSEGIPKVDSGSYFTFLPKNSSTPLHCLVMEKIEGVDLAQWMVAHHYQPISQSQAINWLKQLVEILALVHTHQYFHRDIKPQNIMLRSTGQLVLIDFGAVRQITTTILEGSRHTRIISEGYSPPEQQNGYSVQQSDFFALGRTFIFLVTGKEPQDATIYDPLTNTLNWREHAPQISPSLADLIDKLIAFNANQRPKNTHDILKSLQEIEKTSYTHNTIKQLTNLWLNKSFKIVGSSSFVSTLSIAKAKPYNSGFTSATTKLVWKLFVIFGLGCSSIAVAAFYNLTTKNIVTSREILPIITPASSALPILTSHLITEIFESEATFSSAPLQKKESLRIPSKNLTELELAKSQINLKNQHKVTVIAQVQKQKNLIHQQVNIPKKTRMRLEVRKIQRDDQVLLKQKFSRQQLSSKLQLDIKKVKDVNSSSNNYIINVAKPWENRDNFPKPSDELEIVIKKRNR